MSGFLLLVQTFKYSMLIVSFADRDMVMRHFGFGIGHGHVNFDACQRNNEDDLGSDSESESDAMDLMPES